MKSNNKMYASTVSKAAFLAVLVASAAVGMNTGSAVAQITSSVPDVVPQPTLIQGQVGSSTQAPYPVLPHGPSINLRNGFGPTATESESNATTVPVQETQRRPGVAPAPRSGLSPTATDSERNATSVQETQRRSGVSPAPRIGSKPAWFDPS